jgi:hypothetical protein
MPSGSASTFISDHILGITAIFLIHIAHAKFSSKTWTTLSPNGHNSIALLGGRPHIIQTHRLATLKLGQNSPYGAKVQHELAKCNKKHIASSHHSMAPL